MFLKENSKEKDKEKSQEISKIGEITLSALKPNLSMDNYNRTQLQKATSHSQCFLKIKPERDYQLCIWCINYSLQSERQGMIICIPAKEWSLPSPPESVWKCDSETRVLGVWELCGDRLIYADGDQISKSSLEQYQYTKEK